jgi:hypothetical protein
VNQRAIAKRSNYYTEFTERPLPLLALERARDSATRSMQEEPR